MKQHIRTYQSITQARLAKGSLYGDGHQDTETQSRTPLSNPYSSALPLLIALPN